MNSFLTVEDVNTVAFSNQGFYWHKIDLSELPIDTDFEGMSFDFCKISKERKTISSRKVDEYTIQIFNSKWTLGHGRDNTFENVSYDSETNTITCRVYFTYTKRVIWFYLGNISFEGLTRIERDLVEDIMFLKYNELNTRQSVYYYSNHNRTGNQGVVLRYLEQGYNLIMSDNTPQNPLGYLLVNLVKTDFQFTCNQSVTVGKVNKVYLGTDSDYLPNGDLVGTYTPTITVTYNGETLPVTYDGTDYYFNLDLTDKTSTGKIRFKVLVEANDVLNATETDVVLQSQYQTVNTFGNFVAACGANGNDIIRLGSNLTATSDIPIKHSIKIIGNDKTLDLDGHRFVLDEDVSFNVENLQLDNGDTTIIQAKNTKVELNNVTFNDCTSSNYNGLGSCIFCDVDVDSLDNTDDYITTLTECTFTNNSNCILHGGELTIIGCTLTNDDTTNINTNNVAFVYQTDGTCLIQQSAFTINYDDSTLCSGEINIGYAQALLMCGETANINGANHTDLQGDNTLPFFDAPFNNRADIYAKYYYPQITACVESVTTLTHKSCCHSVSNIDWVFKNNVTVRRVE